MQLSTFLHPSHRKVWLLFGALLLLFAPAVAYGQSPVETHLLAGDWQWLLDSAAADTSNSIENFVHGLACTVLGLPGSHTMVFGVNVYNPDVVKINQWAESRLTDHPANPYMQYAAAVSESITGAYAKAEALLGKVIAQEPKFGAAYSQRSLLRCLTGRLSEALEDINKAAQLQPDNVQFLSNRATVLDGLNRHEEAIADLQKAILVSPNNPALYFNQGNSYRKIHKDSLALAAYTTAIKFDSTMPEPYFNRANTERDLGDIASAAVDYEMCAKLCPDAKAQLRGQASGLAAAMRLTSRSATATKHDTPKGLK